MAEPEPCSTATGRVRHYSTNLVPSRYASWRWGQSACGVNAYEEAAFRGPDRRPVVLADLPECRTCLRILATAEVTT